MKHLILIILAFSICSAQAESQSIDERCQTLGKKFMGIREDDGRDYTLIETRSFYSEKIDSCVHIEKKLVGVEIRIKDLSRSVIIDGPVLDEEFFPNLLYCDIDGVDSVILEKVRKHKGRVWNDVPTSEYHDDGFGGLPRLSKIPDTPYTKAQCQKVLDKWLDILE